MNKHQIEIKSWNRFFSNNLMVRPEILGKSHFFNFENSLVSIIIPSIDQVGRSKEHDVVASISARRTINNVPLEIDIHKVDVEVCIPIKITIPDEILRQNPNAYELLSESQQNQLNKISDRHQLIAERAFNYWIRVVRWIIDEPSIGLERVYDFRSGWGTYLIDTESNRKMWIGGDRTFHVPRYKIIELEQWEDIQSKLTQGSQPPVYLELKHDAENYINIGDYRHSIVNMAVACETFITSIVLQSLPKELSPELSTYIEKANIHNFIEKFFPETIGDSKNKQFKAIKSNLKSLFKIRNKLLHTGKDDVIDKELCDKFLDITEKLFSITT